MNDEPRRGFGSRARAKRNLTPSLQHPRNIITWHWISPMVTFDFASVSPSWGCITALRCQ